MGVYYLYVNLTKRQRFSIGAVGGGIKRDCIGRTLAARAFELMLSGNLDQNLSPVKDECSWAGDSVMLVGDEFLPDYYRFKDEFTDVGANAIMVLLKVDGFDEIAEVAEKDETLFMQLAHMVLTRQAPRLAPYMEQRFGRDFLRRYQELCKVHNTFEPLGFIEDSNT
jgi:hypothetical protein